MGEQPVRLNYIFSSVNSLLHALQAACTQEWTSACFEHIGTVPDEGKICLGNCLVYFQI